MIRIPLAFIMALAACPVFVIFIHEPNLFNIVAGCIYLFTLASVGIPLSNIVVKNHRKLVEQSSQLDAIFNSSQTMIWKKDTNNVMLKANTSGAKIMGMTPESIEGVDCNATFTKEEADHYFIDDKEVIETKKPKLNIIEYVSSPNGDKIWVRTDKMPLFDKRGNVNGLLVFSTNITEIQEAKIKADDLNNKLQKKAKELEQFAYIASHDLQQPLRTVNSYIQLFTAKYAGKIDDQCNRYLKHINTAINRMTSLVNGLLEYSRSGERNLDIHPIFACDVIKSVLESLETDIKITNTSVSTSGCDMTILCDQLQVARVFQNIISNAIKYSKPGIPPEISIICAETEDQFSFVIIDKGLGIEKANQESIFDSMTRFDPPGGDSSVEGTGFGLAVCKRIIEAHNGSICVESTPGERSEFYFTLPKVQNNDRKVVNC
jgi:PAS domain S-box-containing protein